MCFDFTAYEFLSSRKIVHLLSQICPRDINDKICIFFNTLTCCAVLDKVLFILMIPCLVSANVSASGRITDGPEYFVISDKQWISSCRQ